MLISTAGRAVVTPLNKKDETPYGQAQMTVVTVSFPEEQMDLLFRLGRVAGVPVVLMQAGIRNCSQAPIRLVSATPVAAEFEVEGTLSEWLVTELQPPASAATTLQEIVHQPLRMKETGSCYRADKTGFLFGPVGNPVAYLETFINVSSNSNVTLRVSADMSGVRVDPGETRWGQQVALMLEEPQAALVRWAGWVAQSHGARTGKGALIGWNNAHPLNRVDVRKELADVIATVRKSEGRLRPGLIQIDDGGECLNRTTLDAPWIPEYAQQVRALGARFGIRLDFDSTADLSSITSTVQHAISRGFSYVKICHPVTDVARDAKRTTLEAYRNEFTAIRRAAGEDAYICYGGTAPNRAVVGLVDASRVGRDATRENLRAPIDDVLRSYPLCGRWFAADCDSYYLGTWLHNESQINGEFRMARQWLTMVAFSGGTAVTSDPWHLVGFKAFWRNHEILSPPPRELPLVQDMGTSRDWPCLISHVHRDWGDWTLAILWNPGWSERVVKFDFGRGGMNPNRAYAVWTFWDNRFIGVAQGSWSTHFLIAPDLQLVRFTELEPGGARPRLVGSNLHISCGGEEIKRIKAGLTAMTIELTDAGAREGHLFVHSTFPPVLRNAVGCEVADMTIVSESVWRIHLKDRQINAPQRIELAFLVPITQQTWFRVLLALVFLSLSFAAWRYVLSLRSQHQRTLAEERTRISQDLHDELGADLTYIGLLSELAQRHLDDGTNVRDYLHKVYDAAHVLSRQLDAVVWAVNPANDTLDSLAQYLCKYTQEFLASANIPCRLVVPLEFKAVFLTASQRHNLFLAVKEALHNAVRHAGATLVTLRIVFSPNAFAVEIEDDGKGFINDKRLLGQDGLDSMLQRLNNLGGRCEFLTGPNARGTIVRLTMPLKKKT